MLQEMKGGLAYARSQPSIIALTVLAFLTTFLGLPLLTFLPVFAREIFHGEVAPLHAHDGVLGRRRGHRRARRRLARTLQAHGAARCSSCRSIFGALIAAFALSRVWWWSCAAAVRRRRRR